MKAMAIVGALLLLACDPKPLPPEPPPPILDAGRHATCADVCDRWAALGCSEGRVRTRCVDACEAVGAHPEIMIWNLDCRARVSSCAAIDRCEGR